MAAASHSRLLITVNYTEKMGHPEPLQPSSASVTGTCAQPSSHGFPRVDICRFGRPALSPPHLLVATSQFPFEHVCSQPEQLGRGVVRRPVGKRSRLRAVAGWWVSGGQQWVSGGSSGCPSCHLGRAYLEAKPQGAAEPRAGLREDASWSTHTWPQSLLLFGSHLLLNGNTPKASLALPGRGLARSAPPQSAPGRACLVSNASLFSTVSLRGASCFPRLWRLVPGGVQPERSP